MEITMARGDLYCFPFCLMVDEEQSTDLPDNIYFTVKKFFGNPEYLFQKKLSDGSISTDGLGNYWVTILPQDTDNLEFGFYDFDIEVVKLPELKRTFQGKLELTAETTHAGNEDSGPPVLPPVPAAGVLF